MLDTPSLPVKLVQDFPKIQHLQEDDSIKLPVNYM